ncbi:hypothetical protein HDR63_03120 [bacterium]|nr:hypothetical protein [bacterium]
MLNGISVFTRDAVWRRILTELGATVTDEVRAADVDLDALGLGPGVTPVALKAALMAAQGSGRVLADLFGHAVVLPGLQARVVVALVKSGGMRGAELKAALGYSPDAATHAIDTAIYQLRRTYGRDFIQNDGGVYRIGKL